MSNTPLQDIQEMQADVGILDLWLHADATTMVDFSAAQDGSDMRPSLAMFMQSLGGGRPAALGAVAAAKNTALPAYTFTNTAGGTITANANGALPNTDTVAPVVNQRLWLLGGAVTFGKHCGIYVVTQVGSVSTPFILTRATDANSAAELGYVVAYVVGGATFAGSVFEVPVGAANIVLNTTDLTPVQTSGANAVGAETARATAAEAAIQNGLTNVAPLNAANFTLDGTAKHWPVDDTGGNIVCTVPAGAGFMDQEWIVSKKKASANTITVTMSGADTINGAATYVLHNQYDFVDFQNINGSGAWIVIGHS